MKLFVAVYDEIRQHTTLRYTGYAIQWYFRFTSLFSPTTQEVAITPDGQLVA